MLYKVNGNWAVTVNDKEYVFEDVSDFEDFLNDPEVDGGTAFDVAVELENKTRYPYVKMVGASGKPVLVL